MGIDLTKVHVVDLSEELKKIVPPTWSVCQSSQHYGRDLWDLENAVTAELGIRWPVVFGEELPGEFEQEQDCAQVAVGMMRHRPDLMLFVKCSDPDLRPTYSPLAHFEIKMKLSFE